MIVWLTETVPGARDVHRHERVEDPRSNVALRDAAAEARPGGERIVEVERVEPRPDSCHASRHRREIGRPAMPLRDSFVGTSRGQHQDVLEGPADQLHTERQPVP